MQIRIAKRPLMTALLAGTAAISAQAPAAAAEAGRIAEITFYSGGVAEIVRTAGIEGSEAVLVTVPVSQVSDVLKSLVLRDPAGQVGQISLAGSGASDAVFTATPFDAETLKSVPKLLDALRGNEIRLSTRMANSYGEVDEAPRLVGTVMGVEFPIPAPLPESEAEPPYLAILDRSGTIHRIAIERGTTVEVVDEAIRAEIASAAARLARSLSDATRTVEVNVVGKGRRTVEVDYVVAAPVWKSSHRLVIGDNGEGRLQSWAIVENVSGEDWDDVGVALSSGSPVTLQQNLFDPYWRERPEVPVFVDRQEVPEADRGTIPLAGSAARGAAQSAEQAFGREYAAMPAPVVATAEDSAGKFGMSGAADVAASVEGDVSVSYRVERPVDLAAGESLSVPIVDSQVPAERLAIFTPGRGDIHPTAAVRLTNRTGAALPAGIVTVYDASGYVGDSTLLPVPAGEERLVQFALDRKVTIATREEPSETLSGFRIADGVLRYQIRSRRSTSYTAENGAPEARTVSIEHPKLAGWELETNARQSETADAFRLEATVPAGGTTTIEAVETRLEAEGFALVDASLAMLEQFATGAGDPEVAQALNDLAALRIEAAGIEQDIADLDELRQRIVEEQDRLRQNLVAVGQTDLARTYLDKLRDQESELGRIEAERERLRSELEAAEARIRSFIASL